jgi:hypothetical protein
VPAAAVIPAPIAYTKVVAVKKLIVELQTWPGSLPHGMYCVMNMTFMRTDRRKSQLSIKPTHSQIRCVDQELSQLRGFAKIYICRNDQVLSAQIGVRTDRTGAWKASQISWVWTGSRSKEGSVPRKEVLSAQLA